MTTANEILGQVLALPEPERSRLALALLDALDGPNPEGELSGEAFREEMGRRADEALARPEAGVSWHEVRASLT